MGEIADAMINGESCSLCGCYFVEAHGYPVICEDCYAELNAKEKKMHQKAIHEIEG